MADDFAARARAALTDAGITMRQSARLLNYDPAYLSRVLNGKQRPSIQLADGLDRLVGADGALSSLVMPVELPSASPATRPAEGTDGEVEHMRATVAHVLAHDDRYGGDEIAPVAVRVWRAGQRKLDSGSVPDRSKRDYLSAVAELAEVAGWLLFDADQQDASRMATLDAHMLARHAGDRPLQWFALTNLAMQATENNRPGEALRIADELLNQPRIPPRVALLARVRQGRALAQVGERRRALAELGAARIGLEESITPRDPAWTWWVSENELIGHEAEALLILGDVDAAESRFQRAAKLVSESRPDGRGMLYYQVSLLSAHVAAKAWRECESVLMSILPLLDLVSSGRNRRRLKTTLRTITRDPSVPTWFTDVARDVASFPQLSGL